MSVQITIKGENLDYQGETTLNKAGQILAFLGTEQTSPHSPAPAASVMLPALQSTITPRNAISEANAKSNPQKIAALGKYLRDRGQNAFTRSEVLEQFRRAGESTPKNIGRDLKDAVIFGFICESDTQKNEYYLTNNGEEAVLNKFAGDASSAKKGSRPKSRKISAQTSEPNNQKLKDITWATTWEGLPKYWDLQKKSDRILWMLYVAKAQDVKEMTNKDIEYVARQLDDDAPASNINALTQAAKKNGYITRKGAVYTLLGPGTTYVKNLTAAA